MSENILKQSVLREKVFSKLDELGRMYAHLDLTAHKTAYLMQLIDFLEGKVIVSDDGKDVTHEFINGIHNLITNPAERELQYAFAEVSQDEFMEPQRGYVRKPACEINDKDCYLIFDIPNNREIGKACIKLYPEICEIHFIELKEEYKKKYYFSDIMKDAVLGISNYRTTYDFVGNYLGEPV